jgi:SET domain-containing protein
MIEIRKSNKFGRGVFAAQTIAKDTVIERAPLIVLDEADTKMVRDSNVLVYYDFSFNDQYSAIAGGYGSFYNHSPSPNVDWEVDQEAEEIKYWTTQAIEAGEQLFINYGYDAKEYFTVAE